MPDGTTRFKCKGKEIFHFVRHPHPLCSRMDRAPELTGPLAHGRLQMGCSTFSQYTVVSKFSVVTINDKAPLEKACLLGCGITTGYGAATKSAGIEGSTVAVFGIGCVGLSVLQGAKAKNCSRVIAIDTNNGKKDLALKFGATEFINPAELADGKKIQDHLVEITDGGLDFTFDATGNVRP